MANTKELTKKVTGEHLSFCEPELPSSLIASKTLSKSEYYSQRAIGKFDSARFKMRLYVADDCEPRTGA